jgi:hypothetical protein
MADLKESPSEITEKIEETETYLNPLRARWQEDLDLIDVVPFQMDKKVGNFQNVTTGRAAIIANKVIGLLSNARPVFSYNIEEATETDRTKLSTTERFVYVAMEKANKFYRSPFTPVTIHEGLSFSAPSFGWSMPCVWVYKDDEENKNAVFDVRLFDPLATSWGYADNALAWVATRVFLTPEDAKAQYPDANIISESASANSVEVLLYITPDYETAIINDQWAKEPHEHGLGYVPVLVQPARSRFLVQGLAGTSEEIKFVGESMFAACRHLFTRRSEAMTYYMTALSEEVRQGRYGEYDGTAGSPPDPPNMHPDSQGQFLWLDVAKKQKVIPRDYQGMSSNAKVMFDILEAEISQATLSPISFGYVDAQMPASAVAMALNADSHAITPFKSNIETCEQWIAMQLIKQYQKGDYKEMAADGYDAETGKRFTVKTKPEDLEIEREIHCELMMRSIWEELQNANVITTLYEKGLISGQTSRDNLKGLVPDTDAEQGRITREKAMQLPGVMERLMINELLKDKKGAKNPETLALVNMLVRRIEELEAKEQGAGQGQPGQPPQQEAGIQQLPGLQIPPEIQTAARMNNIGLTYARR